MAPPQTDARTSGVLDERALRTEATGLAVDERIHTGDLGYTTRFHIEAATALIA